MKNKKIIICILIILIIAVSILLCLIICGNKKTAEEKLKKLTCGKDGDNLTLALCDRYEEKGYIVLYKENTDLNTKYVTVNTLLDKVPGLPVVFVDSGEIDDLLRTHFKTPEKEYKHDDVLYFIDYGNIEFSKIEKAVKEIDCLGEIYKYSGTKKYEEK